MGSTRVLDAIRQGAGQGAALEEIDVSVWDQIAFRYLQRLEQGVRFVPPGFHGFAVSENNFQFEERSKVLDDIQVNPGPASQEDLAVFGDDASPRQDSRERFAHRRGVGTRHSRISRLFRPPLVGSFVGDQLT